MSDFLKGEVQDFFFIRIHEESIYIIFRCRVGDKCWERKKFVDGAVEFYGFVVFRGPSQGELSSGLTVALCFREL